MRKAATFVSAAMLLGCAGVDAPDTEQVADPVVEEMVEPVVEPAAEVHASEPRGPMTIEELREHDFDASLTVVRPLDDGPSFTAYLVAYEHAGLTLHAMVAVPRGEAPDAGFPVVIANHGYVPDPRRYGITAEGVDSRPGDYYRSVPELFTSRGFLTVIPDYRGHNSSDGFEYIDPQDDDSIAYYAEDVVALMSALDDLDGADLSNVFMWSHSMGGPVSLRAMLATDVVKAASFWSTMPLDDLDPYIPAFKVPVVIQHQMFDEATPYENSQRFGQSLRGRGVGHLTNYRSGSDHFFTGDDREEAADRDVEYFREYME